MQKFWHGPAARYSCDKELIFQQTNTELEQKLVFSWHPNDAEIYVQNRCLIIIVLYCSHIFRDMIREYRTHFSRISRAVFLSKQMPKIFVMSTIFYVKKCENFHKHKNFGFVSCFKFLFSSWTKFLWVGSILFTNFWVSTHLQLSIMALGSFLCNHPSKFSRKIICFSSEYSAVCQNRIESTLQLKRN